MKVVLVSEMHTKRKNIASVYTFAKTLPQLIVKDPVSADRKHQIRGREAPQQPQYNAAVKRAHAVCCR